MAQINQTFTTHHNILSLHKCAWENHNLQKIFQSKATHPNRYTITEQTNHLLLGTFKLPQYTEQHFLNKTTENEIIHRDFLKKRENLYTISKSTQYRQHPEMKHWKVEVMKLTSHLCTSLFSKPVCDIWLKLYKQIRQSNIYMLYTCHAHIDLQMSQRKDTWASKVWKQIWKEVCSYYNTLSLVFL